MAYDGTTWDEANPQNSTIANLIDDYMQDLKKGIRSRMALEHVWPSTQSATNEAGAHKFVTFQPQTAAPTMAGTTAGGIYCDTATAPIPYFVSSAGTDYDIMISGTDTAQCGAYTFAQIPTLPAANPTATNEAVRMGYVNVVANTHSNVTAASSGTTQMPVDDTIPQIDEGNEYMTLAHTPQSATNVILVEAFAACVSANVAGQQMGMALFEGTTAGALSASALRAGSTSANAQLQMKISHSVAAGTTGEQTYRIRIGGSAAGQTTFNGGLGARFFGGKMGSFMRIQEIRVQ